jgi:hypothetical protein
VIEDHAGAGGEAEPVAVRIAQMCRNPGADRFGIERLKQGAHTRALQIASVNCHQHIDRAVGTLRCDALDQGISSGLDPVHRNPGLCLEGCIEHVVCAVMAGCVEIDHLVCLGLPNGGSCQQRAEAGPGGKKLPAIG